MPPRRRAAAAAAPAPPPPPPLDGCVVTLFGRFNFDKGPSQPQLRDIVASLGGSIAKSVAGTTTHLVTTESEYDYPARQVVTAISRGLPIVNVNWILESQRSNTKADESKYSFAQPSTAPGNGQTQNPPNKRPIGGDDDDDDASKAKKKTEGGANATTNGTAPSHATGGSKAGSKVPKEEKQVADGQFVKKKGANIPIDDYFPHPNYQVYIDSTGMIYDASLNQSNSANNNNKFYRLQVLFEPQSNNYHTWTRWGRVGEVGQSAVLGNGTLQDAVKNFDKKFRDKSGLSWANRGDDPKPHKYAFVERSYNPDSDDESDDNAKVEEDDYQEPECTLQQPVRELMDLIFNQQYFNAAMASLNYDANKLPLGKLSKATISRGFQQLKDIAALMDDASLGPSRWDMPAPAAVEFLSNTYYSVIPHAFGRNRPPVIRSDVLLKTEIELLESLSDMKDAAELMKIDRKTADTVHQLDRQFQGLGLEEMTVLDPSGSEFSLLERYLNESRGATHNFRYQVEQIFRIERQGEKQRFDDSPFASMASDRRLLWHGSRCTNFGGILSQGLRIAPPEAPVSGYMFGKGIYLADMSSKSAGYCCSFDSNRNALLLLCEAELGDPMQELTGASYSAGDDAKAKGMASTWGMGGTGPNSWIDAGTVHESLKGIKMPDTSVAAGPTNVPHAGLYYNEYICYDVAQVRLRYLFRVKM